jgi:hypothetical protein
MNSNEAAAIPAELGTNGWMFIPADLVTRPSDIFSPLGRPIPSRNGGLYHDLAPYTKAAAPRASTSASTGTDRQPMHTDAAFDPSPPRYIVFQCLDPGEASCPTQVWSLDVERLERDRPPILTRTDWVSHGGGLRPFYCSIMDVRHGGIRIRFDSLCMRHIRGRNRAANEAEEVLGSYSAFFSFEWKRGSMLIVDNWRCLHARGKGGEQAPSRRLRRWSIGVEHGLVV